MLRNYILTAWRGARRDLSSFLINMIGLIVGFTVFTLAFSFAHYMESFDRSFERADRTYTLGLRLKPGNFFGRDQMSRSFTGSIDGLKERASEIELAGRVISGRVAYEKDGLFLPIIYRAVDLDTFAIFDIQLTSGSLAAFSGKLETVLLSDREAAFHFGTEDPIGKTFNLNNTQTVTVVGTFADLPANTHLMSNPGQRSAFDFVVSVDFHDKLTNSSTKNAWNNIRSSVTNYIVAREGVSLDVIEQRLTEQLFANTTADDQEVFTGMWPYGIDNLQIASFQEEGVDLILVVRIVGGLILGLAVLNAISLASARMINRSREIGLRRVFGAHRRDLTFQFIMENTAYAMIALAVAILASFDLFGTIAELSGLNLDFSYMLDLKLILGLIFAAITVGLISSFYPILLFSGILKNVSLNRTLTLATSTSWLRKTLVAFQFTAVTALTLTFIVVQLQNQHMANSTLKVDTEHMAAVTGLQSEGMSRTVAETIRAMPGVKSVSRNNLPPYYNNTNITTMNILGIGDDIRFRMVAADNQYFEQLGVKLLAGRMLDETREADYISPEEASDRNAPRNYVVNETAMRQLGFTNPDEIIGHTFTSVGRGQEESSSERTIIGVVPDTRIVVTREEIMATIYRTYENSFTALTVLYEDGAAMDITALNKAWQAVDPAELARVRPLATMADDALFALNAMKTAVVAVTLITITMAAAGLYALTAYLAASKKREVGIRKVHGAPIQRILRLLMWQFTKPVMLSLALGLPLTFLILKTQYLTQFADRIELGFLPVTMTVALVLITALATSFVHILRAARSRPAAVLRSD